MSGDRPSFRRDGPRVEGPPLWGLLTLLGFFVLVALSRPLWAPRLPEGTLVEVTGAVPQPGTWLVEDPTVEAAVRAAGGELEDPRPVPAGYRVHVGAEGVAILPPSDPLLVALPVDLNQADVGAIDAIPGVGRTQAERIVADREARGAFYTVEDLLRVPGVGRSALEGLLPFVTVGDPGERPPPPVYDPNSASAAELETLPGIGPVTAARIVVEREDHGPFRSVDDLERVRGIGPATVDRIRDRLEVGE